ncbi:hypothetical protein KUCAC02_032101, partial [Chaenocephalus aceratus]
DANNVVYVAICYTPGEEGTEGTNPEQPGYLRSCQNACSHPELLDQAKLPQIPADALTACELHPDAQDLAFLSGSTLEGPTEEADRRSQHYHFTKL